MAMTGKRNRAARLPKELRITAAVGGCRSVRPAMEVATIGESVAAVVMRSAEIVIAVVMLKGNRARLSEEESLITAAVGVRRSVRPATERVASG